MEGRAALIFLIFCICVNSLLYSQQVQTNQQNVRTNLSIQAVPGIGLEKTTNGTDADTPPGPEIFAGVVVTLRYSVSNLGNVDLSNITVTDNVEGVIGTISSLPVGTTKTLSFSGVAKIGQYSNNATASCIYGGNTVQVKDSSHYYGVTNESFDRRRRKLNRNNLSLQYMCPNYHPGQMSNFHYPSISNPGSTTILRYFAEGEINSRFKPRFTDLSADIFKKFFYDCDKE